MDYYENKLREIEHSREIFLKGKIHAKRDDVKLVYQKLRGLYGTQIVSPWRGFATKSLEMGGHVLPPGHHKGTHRHHLEAIIYILSGTGYSVIDGEKYEWGPGDALCVPSWTWHAHWNLDPGNEVRYLTLKNKGLVETLLLSEIEETNDAHHLEEPKLSVPKW